LLEASEAAFDDVALAVDLPVEAGGPAAPGSAPVAVGNLVGSFGDGVRDATAAQVGADFPRAVALVGDDMVGAGARPTGTGARDVNGVQDVLEAGAVVGVAAGQDEAEWPAVPVGREVDLGAQSSTGPAEGVITRFVLVEGPLFPPVACW
jgi:hypothetical protein